MNRIGSNFIENSNSQEEQLSKNIVSAKVILIGLILANIIVCLFIYLICVIF
jgi:hypothetical protein